MRFDPDLCTASISFHDTVASEAAIERSRNDKVGNPSSGFALKAESPDHGKRWLNCRFDEDSSAGVGALSCKQNSPIWCGNCCMKLAGI